MLRRLLSRIDRLQQRLVFRVVATVLVLGACGGVFGSLLGTSASLDNQRMALIAALEAANLQEQTPDAISLTEEGVIVVDGIRYGDESFKEAAPRFFDENGNIVSAFALAEALLAPMYPEWAPRWMLESSGTTTMLAIISFAWFLGVIWLGVTVPFLLTLLGTILAALVAGGLWGERAVVAIVGIGILTFSYVVLTRVFILLYDRPRQVFAVAHTVIREATRTGIPLIFVVLLLVFLPLIPAFIDSDQPLRFQIQTFISRSLGTTFYITAVLTIIMSCATVAFEIRDRQIWQIVTKPVGRFSYLFGKWVGLATINLIILAIAAVSIFGYIQYQRQLPVASGAAGQEDLQQIRDAILTARVGSFPEYETITQEQLSLRIDDAIRDDPELALLPEVPIDRRRLVSLDIQRAFSLQQRSILPGEAKEYVFTGLGAARDHPDMLTLRYKFHILRDDEHATFPAWFMFNDDPQQIIQRTYVPTMSHVLSLPSSLIQEDGTLKITIANGLDPRQQYEGSAALNFEAADFEVLYRVGSFESNFLRAVTLDWIKLSFLSMLGLCCATFLSFPVACLTSATVFAGATVGPFLSTALRDYLPPETATMNWSDVAMVIQWAFQSVIRGIASVTVLLLESFSEYRATQALVQGRAIGWPMMLSSFLQIGVLWSGMTLFVGFVVLRRRQLAIYSGQG